jgi:hypothetical protein
MVDMLDQALPGVAPSTTPAAWARSISTRRGGTDRPGTTRRSPPRVREERAVAPGEGDLGLVPHPLAGIGDQLRRKTDRPLAEPSAAATATVVSAGSLGVTATTKGRPDGLIRLDDSTGSTEAVFNPSTRPRELCDPTACS